MESVPVTSLELGERLAQDLYHSSGRLVLNAGSRLGTLMLAALKRAGVEELLACHGSEGLEIAVRLRRIETPVSQLRVGRPLESSVYDGEGELLLASGQILLQHHVGLFKRKGLETVWRLPERPFEEMAQVSTELGSLIERALRGEPGGEVLLETGVVPSGPPASREWRSPNPGERAEGYAGSKLLDRMAGLTEIAEVLREIRAGGRPGESPIDAKRITKVATDLLDALAADEPLAVAAAHFESDLAVPDTAGGAYIVDHSANVCALSMAAGARTGLARGELIELGSAALLHDVGMLFTPAWIANKRGALTPEEFLEVRRHVRYGYAATLGPWGFPTSVPVAIHMYHERSDGRGYPDGRSGDAIHPYARIIAAADVYDAVGHARPHRPAALPPGPAEEVARMARAGSLDREAARALLSVTSSYPPGTVLRLESGEVARVVEVPAADPKRPVLSVVRTAGGGPPGEMRLLRLGEAAAKLDRVLTPEDYPAEFGEGF